MPTPQCRSLEGFKKRKQPQAFDHMMTLAGMQGNSDQQPLGCTWSVLLRPMQIRPSVMQILRLPGTSWTSLDSELMWTGRF